MDGWIDELMDEWMDGWMDGVGRCISRWMDGWMSGWRDGCIDAWMDRCMNGWMDGWMYRWMCGWERHRAHPKGRECGHAPSLVAVRVEQIVNPRLLANYCSALEHLEGLSWWAIGRLEWDGGERWMDGYMY